MHQLIKRSAAFLALYIVLLVSALPAGAVASPTATASIKLHSGEFCTKSKQAFYHRHGFTCRRASDGRLRLFEL